MADLQDNKAANGPHTTKPVTFTCKHGEHQHTYENILWAGPVGECHCCGQYYLYLESAFYSGKKSGGTSWVPRNTCEFCGGHYEEWVTDLFATDQEANTSSSNPLSGEIERRESL